MVDLTAKHELILDWLRKEAMPEAAIWQDIETMRRAGCDVSEVPATHKELMQVLTDLLIAQRVKHEGGLWLWQPPKKELKAQGRLFE